MGKDHGPITEGLGCLMVALALLLICGGGQAAIQAWRDVQIAKAQQAVAAADGGRP